MKKDWFMKDGDVVALNSTSIFIPTPKGNYRIRRQVFCWLTRLYSSSDHYSLAFMVGSQFANPASLEWIDDIRGNKLNGWVDYVVKDCFLFNTNHCFFTIHLSFSFVYDFDDVDDVVQYLATSDCVDFPELVKELRPMLKWGVECSGLLDSVKEYKKKKAEKDAEKKDDDKAEN